MKLPERLKLVEDIRILLTYMAPYQKARHTGVLLKQAADCIEQLEKELDKIHENFLKDENL